MILIEATITKQGKRGLETRIKHFTSYKEAYEHTGYYCPAHKGYEVQFRSIDFRESTEEGRANFQKYFLSEDASSLEI